ncbi:hypothetical protein HPB50_004363 [Hyalomma asiaticum]|uniref:Uncharacterized protein n=1 Tax=Hyalomma asiaticum TaxID=266040 RepID=A0ACB7RH92_HYAAI|nr:hypothetical protein HPB50_004363 [Hyalomma asiaticum]
MKEAKAVKVALPSRPKIPSETLGESPAVPMDTHSEVRLAKRKAPSEQIRNEELDFQMQITDSIAEIKETLKHMAEAMASFSARTSKLEEEVGKLRTKKGVKTPLKNRATSSGEPHGSTQDELTNISNDGCE